MLDQVNKAMNFISLPLSHCGSQDLELHESCHRYHCIHCSSAGATYNA